MQKTGGFSVPQWFRRVFYFFNSFEMTSLQLTKMRQLRSFIKRFKPYSCLSRLLRIAQFPYRRANKDIWKLFCKLTHKVFVMFLRSKSTIEKNSLYPTANTMIGISQNIGRHKDFDSDPELDVFSIKWSFFEDLSTRKIVRI